MLRHKKTYSLLFTALVALNILLLVFFLQGSKSKPQSATSIDLSNTNLSFTDLSKYFTDLANSKGAKYAFDQLLVAPLPPNTDLHLLGHVVGDVLYKQQGASGIQICTQDFRNACSHAIVVGLFTDKGDAALNEIEKACQKAPGGSGAYIMCYHGLGHGILAYEDYDMAKTIELCKKTGTTQHGNQEYPECVSGAVMEIISGGGHSHELWVKQRPNYLKADNPLYICSKDFMPEEARGRCYDYVTPYLWESMGANIGSPTDADFVKSFHLCDKIPKDNYRSICYGGFGKEFVGLAQSRDIRRVDQMDANAMKRVINWCNLAPNNQAVIFCLNSALSSIYWGGENDVNASIRFCNSISNPENQKNCFVNLIGQVSSYISDQKYRESFCQNVPPELVSECKTRLIQP